MNKVELIEKKFNRVRGVLDERAIRVWCASEAKSLGYGGITAVHRATGVSRVTITKYIKELCTEGIVKNDRFEELVAVKKRYRPLASASKISV